MFFPHIHSFLYITTALLKNDVSGTQKPSPPTVFNLQASDWVHCDEETGAFPHQVRFLYKLLIFVFNFLKLLIFKVVKIHKIY